MRDIEKKDEKKHVKRHRGIDSGRAESIRSVGRTLGKNSLDDLFIFCSSKILFHMNVSVLRKKSSSFILFMLFE